MNSSFCAVNRVWVQRTEVLHLLAMGSEQEDLPQSNQWYSSSVKYLNYSGQPQPLKRACQTLFDLDATSHRFCPQILYQFTSQTGPFLATIEARRKDLFWLMFSVFCSLYLRPRGRQNMMVAETCGLRWKVETVWGDIRDQVLYSKAHPPVTCVFLLGPPPKFSTIFKRVLPPRD